jgi:hypothetical protein
MPSTASVEQIAGVELRLGKASWAWAEHHAAEIDRHWQERLAENSAFYDGRVHVLLEAALEGCVFRGTFARTGFRSFLKWRESGYPEAGVRDCFGSGLIRSAEGHLLLGVAARHTINAGLAYPPGGFIDALDVAPDGRIDLAGSIAREVAEEVGLDPAGLALSPGYWLTQLGPYVSIAAEYRSDLPAEALRRRMLEHIARERRPELDDVLVVASTQGLAGLATPAFVKPLLRTVLG